MGMNAVLLLIAGTVTCSDEREEMTNQVARPVRTIQSAFYEGAVDTLRGLMTLLR
jgi:hypothetical protein